MRLGFFLALCLSCLYCCGQQEEQKEVGTTIDAFFHFLSFSDSAAMQIDSVPSVFTHDGRLTANFGAKPLVFSAPQYVESIRNNLRSGQLHSSKERELARKIDVFGKIAHVLSTYELTMVGKDGVIVRRGLNSIQLVKADGKWLICSLIWDREGNGLKLPAKYLPEER